MKSFFIGIVMLAGFNASANAQDYKVIAKEYCGCFEMIKDTMNAVFRELLVKISNEDDIKAALKRETLKLNEEKRKEFSTQMTKIGILMDSDESAAGECGLELDEKYAAYNTPEKEKEFGEKLITALKDLPECAFFRAILKVAIAFSDELE